MVDVDPGRGQEAQVCSLSPCRWLRRRVTRVISASGSGARAASRRPGWWKAARRVLLEEAVLDHLPAGHDTGSASDVPGAPHSVEVAAVHDADVGVPAGGQVEPGEVGPWLDIASVKRRIIALATSVI